MRNDDDPQERDCTLTPSELADLAFHAHAALLRMTALDPRLADNPFWTMMRQDAFERFYHAMEKIV